MKTVLLYACALFILSSCQKEIEFPPENIQEEPAEIVLPEPQPEPEPEPEPAAEPVSETVYLRNVPELFNSQKHYKLAKMYTDTTDLWETVPSWAKDDIHTFNDFGDGTIESTESCPHNSFNILSQNWTAYADDEGIKLTWVDIEYQPVTYMLVSAIANTSFKAYRVVNNVKIYFEFQLTGK
jgi:hypothetical protein